MQSEPVLAAAELATVAHYFAAFVADTEVTAVLTVVVAVGFADVAAAFAAAWYQTKFFVLLAVLLEFDAPFLALVSFVIVLPF